MYGDLALEILLELRRSSPSHVPPYNEDKVRQVLEEIRALYDEVRRTLADHQSEVKEPRVVGSMLIQHESIQRNKRCLLAYLAERMARMQRLRWEAGAVLQDDWRACLSASEVAFFNGYNRLLNDYTKDLEPLDITADLQPPKEPKIEVRVVKEFGEFTTSTGATVNLTLGSQHYLKRADVEALIRQGVLEHI
eukprot:m.217328 g.217328  ORF g.217328 m.217328 type:complete len:193 (+) comp51294_c0_seq1:214-792(+)